MEPETFQINITTANDIIGKWANIAASIAQQCRWRPQGKCLDTCQGIAVCNLQGLTTVNAQGRPVQPRPQASANLTDPTPGIDPVGADPCVRPF
jgi:hypothetical protein